MQETDGQTKRGHKWAIPVAIIGAVLVVAAAVLYWVVVPSRKEMPADTNTTRQLSGRARVLLNPQALASGDLGNALLVDVPVKADRNVKVLATDGGSAQVSDTRVLMTGNGQSLGRSEVNYAVDRKTLEAVENPPAGWQVTSHEGLTVSWPIGAGQQDYVAWVNETKATTPVKYVREEDKAGLKTYVYQANSAAAPIVDEQTLATMPKALGASVLAGLAARLPLPDAIKAQLAQALPALGDPVPLNYTYEVKSTYWVEPTTGLVVDTQRQEIRKVVFAGGQIGVPIYDVDTRFDAASVTAASDEAKEKRNSITTYSKTLPLLLLIPGLVLLAAGIIGMVAGRRRPVPTSVPIATPATPAARRAETTTPVTPATPPPPPPAGPVTPPPMAETPPPAAGGPEPVAGGPEPVAGEREPGEAEEPPTEPGSMLPPKPVDAEEPPGSMLPPKPGDTDGPAGDDPRQT